MRECNSVQCLCISRNRYPGWDLWPFFYVFVKSGELPLCGKCLLTWVCNGYRAGVMFHDEDWLLLPPTVPTHPQKKNLLILKQSRLPHIMPDSLLSAALKCTDKYSHIICVRRCLIPYWIILINILRHLVMHQIQHLIEHLNQATLIHKDAVAQTPWQPHWLRGMWHISQPRRNEVTLSHLEERTEAG